MTLFAPPRSSFGGAREPMREFPLFDVAKSVSYASTQPTERNAGAEYTLVADRFDGALLPLRKLIFGQ